VTLARKAVWVLLKTAHQHDHDEREQHHHDHHLDEGEGCEDDG
jgi:hypothetical protein